MEYHKPPHPAQILRLDLPIRQPMAQTNLKFKQSVGKKVVFTHTCQTVNLIIRNLGVKIRNLPTKSGTKCNLFKKMNVLLFNQLEIQIYCIVCTDKQHILFFSKIRSHTCINNQGFSFCSLGFGLKSRIIPDFQISLLHNCMFFTYFLFCFFCFVNGAHRCYSSCALY